jgi:hypothetical protein
MGWTEITGDNDRFESRRKYQEVKALGNLSALPRVLSLKDMLKAMRRNKTIRISPA